ncbi:MAG: YheC/YheD family protein [Clostridia bacterium]|nr:YheC/YheD family protein [Clostridia bacterium]
MRFISVIGETKPGPPNQIFLPLEIYQQTTLLPKERVIIRAGAMEVKAQLAILPKWKRGRPAIVSADIYKALALPPGYSLIAKINPNERLIRLGPILGLFTRRVPSIHSDSNQARFLQLLVQYSRELKILTYIFTPSGINWDKRVVNGYVFRGNMEAGFWEPCTFPIPQVVYDRIGNRRTENMKDVQETKRRLLSLRGLQYFNLRYLNKLETHQFLKTRPEVAHYLPETNGYGEGSVLYSFLDKYDVIYVKPTNGSLGRGIIKVNRAGDFFQYRYRLRNGRIVNGSATSKEALKGCLDRLVKSKPYILQQGLNLRTYNGAPFDIRILMQKNHNGLWRRTKMLARVAKKGSITSNLSAGANPELIADILRNVFGEDPNKPGGLGNRLRKVGDLIPAALEEAMGIQFGELGLDLGIDESGKVWLIEVNSKPYKAMETQKGTQEVVRNSVIRPLGYATFLWMNS